MATGWAQYLGLAQLVPTGLPISHLALGLVSELSFSVTRSKLVLSSRNLQAKVFEDTQFWMSMSMSTLNYL